MTQTIVRSDAKQRVSIGKYTELEPGAYYRIARGEGGQLTLTPVPAAKTDEEVAS